MPKVSIITPFYNGSQYVQKCIESIQTQSFRDFEYIIIDDGSTETENKFVSDIAKKYHNTILISQKNGGQASAVNAGIKIAKGKYIAFCDQDDWYLPGKLQRQVEYLDDHKEIDLVYSDAYVGDENGNITDRTWMQTRSVTPCVGGYKECAKELFKRNFICAPVVVMVKKRVFDDIGLMNLRFVSIYDYDFLFRYFSRGYRVGFIPWSLAVWRTHEGQGSRNIRKVKKEQFGIILSFLHLRKDFLLQRPFLVIKKIVLTIGGFVLNRVINYKQ